MKTTLSIVAALAVAGTAAATPVLQFDLNAFNVQATSGGAPSAFGGLSHTGAVQFSLGAGVLAGMFIQNSPSGPFTNAGFSGFTLTGMSGQVNLSNGMVTGGSIQIGLNNGDTFTTQITPGVGAVTTYVGGGYKLEATTRQGMFSDAMFGNVNVADWFNNQGMGGLLGSFLQFNFNPGPNGAGSSDMDLFVDAAVVPLPAAALPGAAALIGLAVIRRLRRR